MIVHKPGAVNPQGLCEGPQEDDPWPEEGHRDVCATARTKADGPASATLTPPSLVSGREPRETQPDHRLTLTSWENARLQVGDCYFINRENEGRGAQIHFARGLKLDSFVKTPSPSWGKAGIMWGSGEVLHLGGGGEHVSESETHR